jgi:hypothetical protein
MEHTLKLIIKQNEKYMRKLVYAVALAIGLTFFNCEDALSNCLRDLRSPELPVKELKTGYLGKTYYDELIPILPQSSNNRSYNWDFNIEGQIPEGIVVHLGSGKIIIDGVPKAIGIYKFKIFMDVESIDGLQLCDSKGTSKEYTLLIK